MLVGIISSYGQTNIINIYNSKVVINNVVAPVGDTNIIKQTNMVLLSQPIIERLRWEGMLEQRRQTSFKSYLKKIR